MHRRLTAAAAVATGAALAVSATPAAAGLHRNTTSIVMAAGGQAKPYPAAIEVTGETGWVTNVAVTLHDVRHTIESAADILLVSPSGRTSVVMSDACGGLGGPTNPTWVFSQSALAAMPFNGTCDGILYRPTDHGTPKEIWPSAPSGPHTANFDRFVGENPNGTWKLYAIDDYPIGPGGRIAGGWSLALETAAPDAVIPSAGLSGAAGPYPLRRTITGQDGVITDVDVVQTGVFHERLDDLELLLEGPRGQRALLMGDACAQAAGKNAAWEWDDEAPVGMPITGPCPNGTYRPTTHAVPETLPAPAPAGPYGTSLSAFDLTDPNGEWRLYVNDDRGDAARGFLAQRFQLQIQTRPAAIVAQPQGPLAVDEGATLQVQLTRQAPATGALGAGSVRVTSTAATATSGVDFLPVATTVAFAPGQTRATVPVRTFADLRAEGTETLRLTVAEATGDAKAPTPASVEVAIRDVPPPGGGGGGGGGGRPDGPRTPETLSGADRVPPVIRGLRVAGTGRRTAVRYMLSEPAKVQLRVERRRGRRWVRVGDVKGGGLAGRNRVVLPRRVGGRPLRRGAHRVAVVAVDLFGNRATSRPRAFRIGR